MSARFDGARAWALLTAAEQAEVGRLAIESAVCVHANCCKVFARMAAVGWPLDPDDAIVEVSAAMDRAACRALAGHGLLDDDVMPDPPASLDEAAA